MPQNNVCPTLKICDRPIGSVRLRCRLKILFCSGSLNCLVTFFTTYNPFFKTFILLQREQCTSRQQVFCSYCTNKYRIVTSCVQIYRSSFQGLLVHTTQKVCRSRFLCSNRSLKSRDSFTYRIVAVFGTPSIRHFYTL